MQADGFASALSLITASRSSAKQKLLSGSKSIFIPCCLLSENKKPTLFSLHWRS
jgi:hypothetical protein